MYYKCTDHKTCQGRGKLVFGSSVFVPTKDPNHAVRHEEIKRSETLNQLKDGVRSNPTATLKETYDAVSIRRKSLLGQDFNAITPHIQ